MCGKAVQHVQDTMYLYLKHYIKICLKRDNSSGYTIEYVY